jgi:hypothetical protein
VPRRASKKTAVTWTWGHGCGGFGSEARGCRGCLCHRRRAEPDGEPVSDGFRRRSHTPGPVDGLDRVAGPTSSRSRSSCAVPSRAVGRLRVHSRGIGRVCHGCRVGGSSSGTASVVDHRRMTVLLPRWARRGTLSASSGSPRVARFTFLTVQTLSRVVDVMTAWRDTIRVSGSGCEPGPANLGLQDPRL